jgi:hypothetical protein
MNKKLANKITAYIKKWRQILYINSWQIDTEFMYYDDDNSRTIAKTEANYRYLKAVITFYLSAIEARDLSDTELEEYVLHEMVHILLAGHQDFMKHGDDYMVGTMERETQLTTYALLFLDRRKK